MDICFFIGHRDAPTQVRDLLIAEVERHITEYGVLHFIVGRYGSFDAMAASAVKFAKHRHPNITLHLLLPYHPAERPVPVPDGFDGTYYPFQQPVPHRLAIVKANQKMIDTCNDLITYVAHPGNARNFLEYARRRTGRNGLRITNLADSPQWKSGRGE